MTHLFNIVSPVRYCISIGFQEQLSVHCRQGKTTISHRWLVSWHLVHILVHAIIQSTVWKWTLKYVWGRRWFKYLKRSMKSWFIWSDYIFSNAKIYFFKWEKMGGLSARDFMIKVCNIHLGLLKLFKVYSSFKYIKN